MGNTESASAATTRRFVVEANKFRLDAQSEMEAAQSERAEAEGATGLAKELLMQSVRSHEDGARAKTKLSIRLRTIAHQYEAAHAMRESSEVLVPALDIREDELSSAQSIDELLTKLEAKLPRVTVAANDDSSLVVASAPAAAGVLAPVAEEEWDAAIRAIAGTRARVTT